MYVIDLFLCVWFKYKEIVFRNPKEMRGLQETVFFYNDEKNKIKFWERWILLLPLLFRAPATQATVIACFFFLISALIIITREWGKIPVCHAQLKSYLYVFNTTRRGAWNSALSQLHNKVFVNVPRKPWLLIHQTCSIRVTQFKLCTESRSFCDKLIIHAEMRCTRIPHGKID